MSFFSLSVLGPSQLLPIALLTNCRMFSTSCRTLKVLVEHPMVHHVDWSRVAAGYFAVVDPLDGGGVLYLSDREYKTQLHVSMSSDTPLTVLARPMDRQPTDAEFKLANNPKTSPPLYGVFLRNLGTLYSRFRAKFWWVLKDGGSVAPVKGNLTRLIAHWGHTLWIWCGFKPLMPGLGSDLISSSHKLMKILETQGALGLVLYLKVSYVSIQKYVGGQRLNTTQGLGSLVRLQNGLPAWLPLHARKNIRSGHAPTIRLWLSVLYVFRCLSTKVTSRRHPVMKQLGDVESLQLVQTEPIVSLIQEFRLFLREHFVPSLGGIRPIPGFIEGDPYVATRMFHAGPSGTPAIRYAGVDSIAWQAYENTRLGSSLRCMFSLNNDTGRAGLPCFEDMREDADAIALYELRQHLTFPKPPISISRITALYEPAGKVRLIAIFDYWTQRQLKPLHDDLFRVLKGMVWDGTHDQNGLWHHLLSSHKVPGAINSSLDISSATDMIPRELYGVLLDELYVPLPSPIGGEYGHEFTQYSDIVLTLLTDRPFLAPSEVQPEGIHDDPITVRYGRGQPMGALASFGLLGLWHHAWVQFAAHRVGSQLLTFDDLHNAYSAGGSVTQPTYVYGVCGDDSAMIEFNQGPEVADEYLRISELLGIPIKLIKSFYNAKCISFISRYAAITEYSPASFREELNVTGLRSRSNFVMKLIDRGWAENTNLVTFLIRSSMDHYAYIKNVWHYVRNGCYPALVFRALMATLSPMGPLRSMTVSGTPLGTRGFLLAWLSLLQGVRPRIANLQGPNPHILWDSVPVPSTMLRLLISLNEKLSIKAWEFAQWNAQNMGMLQHNAKMFGKEGGLIRLIMGSLRIQRLAGLPHRWRHYSWYAAIPRSSPFTRGYLIPIIPNGEGGHVIPVGPLNSIETERLLEALIQDSVERIEWLMTSIRSPNMRIDWMSRTGTQPHLTEPFSEWDDIIGYLVDVAAEAQLSSVIEPFVTDQQLLTCHETKPELAEPSLQDPHTPGRREG